MTVLPLDSDKFDEAGNLLPGFETPRFVSGPTKTYDARSLIDGSMLFLDAWEIATEASGQEGLESIEATTKLSGREVARGMAVTILRTQIAQLGDGAFAGIEISPSQVSLLHTKMTHSLLGKVQGHTDRIKEMNREGLINEVMTILQAPTRH